MVVAKRRARAPCGIAASRALRSQVDDSSSTMRARFIAGGERILIGGTLCGPFGDGPLGFRLLFENPASLQAQQLALGVLERVVEPFQCRGDSDLPFGLSGRGFLEGPNELAIEIDAPLEVPLPFGHLGNGESAKRRPGIAHHHDEIAGLDAGLGEREPEARMIGLAIDIGAADGEIPGVPGPGEVVDFAAEFPDGAGWSVDQSNIAEFERVDQLKLKTAIKSGDAAAVTFLTLAVLNNGLLLCFDRPVAREIVSPGGDRGQHQFGYVAEPVRNGDAGGLAA